MYKHRASEAIDGGKMQLTYVEMDPSERYGRFKDVLGKGATKTVYRAFDEFLGIEVAWNQVKINDAFRSQEELHKLYSEVHLLKNLNHDSIIRYRKRYKRVNIRAVKDWARQILEGLDYLHGHDPPVIHRDLKCDNIFVNGHLGQVKIGDFGLAAILRGSHHAHSVIGNHYSPPFLFPFIPRTPEFMAPELYEEDYDELVDIYSFGMCVLEMLSSEYPYSECSNPAQIYRKVTLGKLPEAFFHIDDIEARRFVGRCLEKAPNRPSAHELLMDPFLSIEKVEEFPSTTIPHQISVQIPAKSTDMTITGAMNSEDDTIFLRVQLTDKDGKVYILVLVFIRCHARNIDFPFDITSDTPLDVATEMVMELQIKDWEPFEIADMIDEEISILVPSWKHPSSPQTHQQHSFNYFDDDDNDDNSLHHPLYSTSSISSSQASLPGLFPLNDAQFRQGYSLHDWLQEESKVQDDACSDSSSFSYKYSNLKYYSANEDDLISSSHKDDSHSISKTQKCTRFCPDGSLNKNFNNFSGADCSTKWQQKMVRSGSLVDIRSQLLHQKMVEVNKHNVFNTIGAVENIGYHAPDELSCGVFQGKSSIRSWKSNKRV
ncbi:hypothetical protein RD792_013873 [Penstemon davidsonii]|uniref:non-specific serine/threonine protein kinase n=1 Tax=Penstemon davidsonii TaxID=160366 RepID=A0ABR0CMX7_9LAMI|nr:hypothetical protein RD792_013873 [Penstemon davidsonii]